MATTAQKSGQKVSPSELDGEFKNGGSEFVDPETLDVRAIVIRFVISDITPTSFPLEQSFLDGKTWGVNLIAIAKRVKDQVNTSGKDAELTQSLK